MWGTYGHDGVAVCTRYELLYDALNGLHDDAHLGRVQVWHEPSDGPDSTGWEFITTKELKYAPEREVRAIITSYDPLGSGDRHVDLNNDPHPRPLTYHPRNPWVPDSKRRRVDLKKLITGVVISPVGQNDAVQEIELWLQNKGFPISPKRSELMSPNAPTLAELQEYPALLQ